MAVPPARLSPSLPHAGLARRASRQPGLPPRLGSGAGSPSALGRASRPWCSCLEPRAWSLPLRSLPAPPFAGSWSGGGGLGESVTP